MSKTYITEDNVFDIIEIGKKIRLYYDDFNQGTFEFVPYLFRSELRVPLDIINNINSGCNGPDYEIKKSHDIELFDFEIKEDKIIFDIMQGIGVQGKVLNKSFNATSFFMSTTRSKENINHLCSGSGSERLFIKIIEEK